MNDRVNGVDPMTYASRLNLSTVGGLMALSDSADIIDFEAKTEIQQAVDDGQLGMTNALVAWLVGAYNLDVIDVFQLTDGLQTVFFTYESVMATLYEYVFVASPTSEAEEVTQ